MLISTNQTEFFDYTEIIAKDADESEVIQWASHRLMQLFIDGRFQDGASMRDVRLMVLDAKPFTAKHYDAAVELGIAAGMFTIETDAQPQKPGRNKQIFRAGVTLRNFRADQQRLVDEVYGVMLDTARRETEATAKAMKL